MTQLSLFAQSHTPTWDDVHKGRAMVVDYIGPCDGEECFFWRGGCTHTKENYAFPKKRSSGMCTHHRLEWL